ncbi:MAG: UDP-N-acetylglucosamine--N-acetylmuramyl-(pentapeptide) pyrophosphoryl-undecaprenol N-acetylglucosamine transferase [Gemmatimonadota bacterium]
MHDVPANHSACPTVEISNQAALLSSTGSSRIIIAGGGTGGHLMPALAIANAIREARPELEPVLVGATRGVEGEILPSRPFRFHLLPFEPIYRRKWWKNVRWPFIAWHLLRQIQTLLDKEKPVLVIGTGGYASGPVVWLAARRGIPTAIQEQNAFPGMATRRLSKRVRHVYLGLPEARSRLTFGKGTQVFDTGNPIVPPKSELRESAREKFGIDSRDRVVLVTGGSQGALAINQVVAGWIDHGLPDRTVLLWATGRGSYEQFASYHRPPAVQVFDFLDPMAEGMAAADLVVARAGAITLAEICAWGLPSILSPLPTAAADHQTFNARALAESGAAIFLPQSDMTADSLEKAVLSLVSNDAQRQTMRERALARGKPRAAAEIVEHLCALLDT